MTKQGNIVTEPDKRCDRGKRGPPLRERSNTRRACVCIKVESKEMSAMVDTGSTYSLIKKDILSQLQQDKVRRLKLTRTERLSQPRIRAANGHILKMGDTCILTFQFTEGQEPRQQYQVRLIEVEQLPVNMLLGMDFLSCNRATVDIENSQLTLKNRDPSNQAVQWQVATVPFTQQREELALMIEEEGEEDYPLNHASYDEVTGKLPQLERSMFDTDIQWQRAHDLLMEYQDLFVEKLIADPTSRLARITRQLRVRISADARPINRHPYRYTGAKQEAMDKCIKEMLECNIISRSRSAWSSPIVMARKPHRKPGKPVEWRFAFDGRGINALTEPVRYPLPDPELILPLFRDAQVMSTMDFVSGYWQTHIHPEDRKFTGFTVMSGPYAGHYHFNVYPYGMRNSGPNFCSALNEVMAGLVYVCCVLFVDDIGVFSRSHEEHIEHMRRIFERLREYGVKLRGSKCKLFKKKVQYLGYTVSGFGILPSSEKTRAVAEFPRPTSVKEVQRFLGLTNYYRRLIYRYAELAKGMREAVTMNKVEPGKRAKKFQWSADAEKSFRLLQKALCTAPVLAHPDPNRMFILATDASNYALGAVLSQKDDQGLEHPVAYASRKMKNGEAIWDTRQRELLAVLYAFKKFRPYLEAQKFLLQVDHANIKWLINNHTSPRLARWVQLLTEFDFDLEHRPGIKHINADVLSRPPVEWEKPAECLAAVLMKDKKEDLHLPLLCMTAVEVLQWHDEQMKDSWTRNMLLWFIEKTLPKEKSQSRRIQSQSMNYTVLDGVLYYHGPQVEEGRRAIAVPEHLREELLKKTHEGLDGGHLGPTALAKKLLLNYYWPKIWRDCKRLKCEHCMKAKACNRKNSFVQSFSSQGPLDVIAIDLFGPLKTTRQGSKYILTVIDLFTRYIQWIPIQDKEAMTVAKALYKNIWMVWGFATRVICDNGTEFKGVTDALMKQFSITVTRVSAYHPQSNGACERPHRYLKAALRLRLHQSPAEWDVWLPAVNFAYNTAVHSATGHTPYFLWHGRHPELQHHLKKPVGEVSQVTDYQEFAEMIQHRVRESCDEAHGNQLTQKCLQRAYANERIRPTQYQVGQRIFLNHVLESGQQSKLLSPWEGPYTIVKLHRNGTATVDVNGSCKRIHRNRMSPPLPPETKESVQEIMEEERDEQDVSNEQEKSSARIVSTSEGESSQSKPIVISTASPPIAQQPPGDSKISQKAVVGKMCIVNTNVPGIYYVAEVMEVMEGRVMVHYYNSYQKSRQPTKRRYLRAWMDSSDDIEVFTNRPKKTYEPVTAMVDTDDVIAANFQLGRQQQIPAAVAQRLLRLHA